MSPSTGHRGAAAAAAAVLLGGLCLAGCTGVTASKKVTPTVTGGTAAGGTAADSPVPRGTGPAGRAAVDSFLAELQPGTAAPFEAQYLRPAAHHARSSTRSGRRASSCFRTRGW